ncbi:MAG: DUF5652 family protein [Patescibacteria group bacterium]
MDLQSFYAGPVSGGFIAATGVFLMILVLWTLVWKGMALWKAAEEKNKVWFVVLLLVNTVGILDILYIYVFSKKKSASVVEAPKM